MSAAPALRPPHVLERMGGLEFVARRIFEGFVAGTHRSPYRGAGEECLRPQDGVKRAFEIPIPFSER
jgi:hypothetical protein